MNNKQDDVHGKALGLLLKDKIKRKLISFRAKCKDKIKENGDDTTVEGLQPCLVQSSGISEVKNENAITQDLQNQEQVGAEDVAEQEHPLSDPCEDQPHNQEPHRRGRILTTILIRKEIISFHFPIDATTFPNTENLSSNLHQWEVECRKRSSGTLDTYYTHGTTTGKKLRSVTEVVNHLLPEGYTKIESKDKIEKDVEAKEEDNSLEVRDTSVLSHSVSLPKKRKTINKVMHHI
ncbi:uncharacterized protein [Medicago truncatula]|uniref:uncharacterized protein n=1 Tax=Medicago truncatula TaxID=3880 RepID=UPI001967DEC3|nr:uncharacterized protein LOC120579862 [Medicago truncatula]